MPWGNPRTTTPHWRRLRKLVLERDRYDCYICHGKANPGPADEVDHVDGNHDNNDPSNLRAIHDNPCHRRKSSAEGNAARQRLARPPEPHPGLRGLAMNDQQLIAQIRALVASDESGELAGGAHVVIGEIRTLLNPPGVHGARYLVDDGQQIVTLPRGARLLRPGEERR